MVSIGFRNCYTIEIDTFQRYIASKRSLNFGFVYSLGRRYFKN